MLWKLRFTSPRSPRLRRRRPRPVVLAVEVVLPDVAGEHEAYEPEERGVEVEERGGAEQPGLGRRAGVPEVAVHVPDVVHGLRRRRPRRHPYPGHRNATRKKGEQVILPV